MTETYLERELRECRERFEAGDYAALAEAVSWCGSEHPIQSWMEQPILESLLFSFNHGGATSGGRGGGHRVQTGLARLHTLRAETYELELLQGKHGAAQRAADALTGTFAQGSARQIKRSYDKVKLTTNQR